ncbi:MAG: serine protease [Rickettsiales bacterium]|nr:serine protease [Rickettsiales bacterium]
MSYLISFFIGILFVISAYAEGDFIYHLTINTSIGPAVSDYIERGIQKGIDDDAVAILITLDTPGGLDTSMRYIVQSILSSSIPVISFVYPSGSRGASAGTYILYASHIAAMAPGTNLGAATPVTMLPSPTQTPNDLDDKPVSILETKRIQDSVAYLQTLADTHNRNKDWAKDAVQDGASLTALEAFNQSVIDYIATDFSDLIKQISQKNIMVNNNIVTLTDDIKVISILPDFKNKVLTILTSPDIAYLLLIAGIYCLMFEFSTPGLIIPGITGIILLSLSLFGLHLLPLSWVGLLMIIMGSGCLIAEMFISSFGVLGIVGTGIFLGGSLLLLEPNMVDLTISSPLIMMSTLINLLFFLVTVTMVIQSKKSKFSFGLRSIIGKEGISLESFESNGQVSVQGEIWNAMSEYPIQENETIVITNIKDQTLIIKSKKED